MKRKEMIIVNMFLAMLILGFGYLAFKLSINQSPIKAISAPPTAVTAKKEEAKKGQCSERKALKIDANTTDEHLKRLNDYQKLCGTFVTNTMMMFTGFSENKTVAEKNAQAMARKLKVFKAAGVKPLVVVEPYITNEAMSFKTYLSGAYDEGMDNYFKSLKAAGVTDDMMGVWVPFPEANTPSWNNKDTAPSDFALCVNKYLRKLKEYFSKVEGSVLLNATTYEPTDVNWENGDYISLTQYVELLDRNLVNSFGIQGFPWMTNAQQRKRTIFDAEEFLQSDLAIGAAQVLRTKDIWINTGTFASKYTHDPGLTVHLSINERKALLNDILDVATTIREYQQNEYRISINLFSEDKSRAKEATDWSYFQDVESQAVLKEFLARASELEVPISFFDKASWRLN